MCFYTGPCIQPYVLSAPGRKNPVQRGPRYGMVDQRHIAPFGKHGKLYEQPGSAAAKRRHLYWPAHGPGIRDTKNYVESFIAHRKKREQQILDELAKGANTISGMVSDLYNDVPDFLAPGCPAFHAGVCRLSDKKRHHRL